MPSPGFKIISQVLQPAAQERPFGPTGRTWAACDATRDWPTQEKSVVTSALLSGNGWHSYGTYPIYSWSTYSKWWFSIVMLVYQRVAGRTLALGLGVWCSNLHRKIIARYCHCPLFYHCGSAWVYAWVYHGLLFTSAKASNKVCLSLVVQWISPWPEVKLIKQNEMIKHLVFSTYDQALEMEKAHESAKCG